MKKTRLFIFAGSILLSFILSSCVETKTHVVGKGSSLSSASTNIVSIIKSKFDFTDRNIQISANNFWEKGTRLNLPFSSVIAEALSSEFSKFGAKITVQDTGEKPLKAIGSYMVAGNDVLIIVRLRSMGENASTDLVVVEDRISRDNMDPRWLEPEFERIARSLVQLLEFDYSGMQSLKIKTPSFTPGTTLQPELVLGDELSKYMKDAFASSSVFREAGDSLEKADAILKGDYTKMGQEMVFHASIVDKTTTKHFAGAKIATDIQNIPGELLEPKIQSLDDLAQKVSELILKECRHKLKNKANIVYIGKNTFHDSGLKAVTAFGHRIGNKLKDILSEASLFSVTDDPSASADLILSGSYFKDHDNIALSIDLNQLEKSIYGCSKKNIASVQGKLGLKYCDKNLFKPDFKGYTDFLMYSMENKAMAKLPCLSRTDLVINKFRLENKKYFSKFSDYLNDHFLDYFTSSMYFSPVTDTQKILTESSTRGERTIVAVQSSEAIVASMTNVSHYISGSFWPKSNGSIEIKTRLANTDGKVLASEQVLLKNVNVDNTWLKKPKTIVMPPDSELLVELFTQKGRNNLSFNKGEEIIFFAKANKNVFIKIFTSDAEHNVFRIFPNDFDKKELIFKAGEVTSIPNNQYASDFKFEVQGTTGNEMVFAFASDRPLPDLPGSKDAFFGMKQVSLSIKEISDWFTDYTRKRGISLSWDSIPILTMN
jgi:hypothetical protein